MGADIKNLRQEGSRRWVKKGLARLDEESFESALEAFHRAYELDPESADAARHFAHELYMHGKSEEAEKLVRKSLEKGPDPGLYRILAAILLDESARIGEVELLIEEVRTTCRDERTASIIQGHLELERNKPEIAVDLFNKVLDEDPENNTEASEGLARALNLIGIDLSEKGANEEAIFTFKKAADLDPWWSAPHVNLGNCFCALGRNDAARRAYTRGIRLEPDNQQARFNMGRLLCEEGDLTGAEAEFLEVLDIDPEYPDANAELGRIYSLLSRFDLAIDKFQRELELNPDSVPCICNLGIACICSGKQEEGEKYLLKAVETEEDPFTLYTLAGLYATQDRTSDALAMLERAAKTDSPWLAEYLREDDKFESMNNLPGFKLLLETLSK
ncbi:MAG TPA: tetratricopeptide repeat protein [bacterium]|nr:tetratricopeptide repeat protein [bacterium]